jgi:hypothetical protein
MARESILKSVRTKSKHYIIKKGDNLMKKRAFLICVLTAFSILSKDDSAYPRIVRADRYMITVKNILGKKDYSNVLTSSCKPCK